MVFTFELDISLDIIKIKITFKIMREREMNK